MTKDQVNTISSEMDRRSANLAAWWEYDCCPECGVMVNSSTRDRHIEYHRDNFTLLKTLMASVVKAEE